MSIGLVVTRGFGNGTQLGTIKDAVTMGYTISTVIPPVIPTATGLVGEGSTGAGLTVTGFTGNGTTGSGSL